MLFDTNNIQTRALLRDIDETITPVDNNVRRTILRIRDKIGIKNGYRSRRIRKHDYKRLRAAVARHVEHYNSGLTIAEVADLVGVDFYTMKEIVKNYNLGQRLILKRIILNAVEVEFLQWYYKELIPFKPRGMHNAYHLAYRRMFGYHRYGAMKVQILGEIQHQ
jgi:hypothetical protein